MMTEFSFIFGSAVALIQLQARVMSVRVCLFQWVWLCLPGQAAALFKTEQLRQNRAPEVMTAAPTLESAHFSTLCVSILYTVRQPIKRKGSVVRVCKQLNNGN